MRSPRVIVAVPTRVATAAPVIPNRWTRTMVATIETTRETALTGTIRWAFRVAFRLRMAPRPPAATRTETARMSATVANWPKAFP